MIHDARAVLGSWYAAAVAAVQGEHVLPEHARVVGEEWIFERPGRILRFTLPRDGGRLRIIGLGKASLGMARGFRRSLQRAGRDIDEGLLIVRDAPSESVAREPWNIVRGDHPYPGEASLQAARRVIDFIGTPDRRDGFVVLLSGGASALCALPAPGVTLEEKRRVTSELMHAGASIAELNRVRKQLSAIKGGRLADRIAPASLVTLAISDVPGDDPDIIGSAPTWTADRATRGEVRYAVIATLDDALDGATRAARTAGHEVRRLGRYLDGSVEQVADRIHDELAKLRARTPADRSCVLIAGGESLVTVRGRGRGGRAQELAVRLSRALADSGGEARWQGLVGLVAGTDGSDGPTAAAGSFFDAKGMERAQAAGVDLADALHQNDCFTALSRLGDVFITGPTGTNVADVLIAMIPGRLE